MILYVFLSVLPQSLQLFTSVVLDSAGIDYHVMLAANAIQQCLDVPELQPEFLCQLAKQTSRAINPGASSSAATAAAASSAASGGGGMQVNAPQGRGGLPQQLQQHQQGGRNPHASPASAKHGGKRVSLLMHTAAAFIIPLCFLTCFNFGVTSILCILLHSLDLALPYLSFLPKNGSFFRQSISSTSLAGGRLAFLGRKLKKVAREKK